MDVTPFFTMAILHEMADDCKSRCGEMTVKMFLSAKNFTLRLKVELADYKENMPKIEKFSEFTKRFQGFINLRGRRIHGF
jgi:translation initiation factor IF-3